MEIGRVSEELSTTIFRGEATAAASIESLQAMTSGDTARSTANLNLQLFILLNSIGYVEAAVVLYMISEKTYGSRCFNSCFHCTGVP